MLGACSPPLRTSSSRPQRITAARCSTTPPSTGWPGWPRRARRRRARRAAEAGPLPHQPLPGSLSREPAPELSGARATHDRRGTAGRRDRAGRAARGARDADRCAGARRGRPAVRGAARRGRRGGQVAAAGRAGRARQLACGHPVLVGRCLDTAESALPYLPFTEIVGRLADARPELVERHAALRHLLPGHSARAEPAVEDRRFGQVRVFDAVLSVLDELTATPPALVRGGGPALGRPVQPGPAGLPAVPALRPAAGAAGQLPHRRPAPATPAASGAVRAGAAAGGASGWSWRPLDAGGHAGSWSAGWPTAGWPSRRCAGPPGAARATPSSPRSWCRPGPTGCRTSWPSCWSPGSRGWPRTTQQVLRVASVAGRRVRHDQLAAVSGLDTDELEQALRDAVADHVLVAAPGSATDGDAYAFRHALLREAVYHELLPGERSRIHAGYAALLADADRAGTEPGRAAELAHHAWPGTTCRWRWPPRCGRPVRPTSGTAPAELLLHAERALELWPAVPDAEAVAGIDEVHGDPLGGLGRQRHRRPGPRHRARPARPGAGRAACRPRAVLAARAAVRAAPAGPGRPRAGGAGRGRAGRWS